MTQSTTSGETPARQLARFIAKFDPAIAKLVRAARSKLRQRLPGAVELVYDNYNALAIGFGPTERASEAVVSLALYPGWVNLYFMHGATLPDPDRLLKGRGSQGRYLTLNNADDLDRPPVATLLDAALSFSKAPFDPSRRSRTIIKLISERQRPRRARLAPKRR